MRSAQVVSSLPLSGKALYQSLPTFFHFAGRRTIFILLYVGVVILNWDSVMI